MARSPLPSSILFGAVLQVVIVVLGALIPALGARNNIFPIVAAAIAALAGARFSRWSPGAPVTRSLSGGAVAGGVSSLLGSIAAVIAAALPATPVQTVLIATLTGTASGALGGLLGRGLPSRGSEETFPPSGGAPIS